MHVIKCCISRQIHTLCIKTGKQDKSKKYSQFIVINTACFNNSQFALTVQYVQKKMFLCQTHSKCPSSALLQDTR